MQQVVVHKLDWYSKVILTVIAIALVALLFKPLLTSQKAVALTGRQVLDVNLNIDKVGGQKLLRWWEADRAEKGIPLYIDGRITTEQSKE
ncbi:hypothetical protein J7M02_07855 [Candidatus Aerophobetes bacterium]|nr:hypothetical protein [Candidatus Aerophobetes bacterium]